MLKLPENLATAGPPWENAKSVVQLLPPDLEATLLRRRLRWLRRRIVQRLADWERAQVDSWDEVPTARIAKCGRVAWQDFVELHGITTDDGLNAFPVGVVACGSVWSCACCSAKVRARRSVEVELAALAHTSRGGRLVMLTLTIRHNGGDDLAELLEVLKSAWKSMQQDRRWRPVRSELIGSITATEITRGPNGWHPHLHLLLFLEPSSTADRELASWLPEAWQKRVRSSSSSSAPSLRHGVHLLELDATAAGYVSKIADETTRADLKTDSRSVWALLEAVDDGEAGAVHHWREYFSATKGKRAIVWSRGLKARFELEEKSDEELAAIDVDGQVLELVPSGQWLEWCRSLTPSGVIKALAHLEELERR